MKKRQWIFLSTALGGAALLVTGIAAVKQSPDVQRVASANAVPDPSSLKILLAQADRAADSGSFSEAKQLYSQIIQQSPNSPEAAVAFQKLGGINLKILLSPAVTPDSVVYVVKSGDTLLKISKQHHATVELLKTANGLSGDRIFPGQRLKVPQTDFSVIVDKSQNTLTLKNGEEVLKVYRCSTGAGGITPTGNFKITSRLVDPPWYSPEGVILPGDPRNVLGTRWLGFDIPRYGIHGTTDPDSIGKPVTKGCVRLVNADVEELFTLLPEGTSVTIVE